MTREVANRRLVLGTPLVASKERLLIPLSRVTELKPSICATQECRSSIGGEHYAPEPG